MEKSVFMLAQAKQPFIMKQLNASGLSLAINYVGNKPDSPLASKLLQSARPEAITITRPAGKYQQLGGVEETMR